MSTGGMRGAPVLKGLMACSAISSLLSMKNGQGASYIHLGPSRLPVPIAAAGELFSFTHPTELAIGLFML